MKNIMISAFVVWFMWDAYDTEAVAQTLPENVTYCTSARTGQIIIIQGGACPAGYY
tara:strand:- start:910 stop:1077 length:168 start_codon:yes stop_codon:yes gene_type:complete